VRASHAGSCRVPARCAEPALPAPYQHLHPHQPGSALLARAACQLPRAAAASCERAWPASRACAALARAAATAACLPRPACAWAQRQPRAAPRITAARFRSGSPRAWAASHCSCYRLLLRFPPPAARLRFLRPAWNCVAWRSTRFLLLGRARPCLPRCAPLGPPSCPSSPPAARLGRLALPQRRPLLAAALLLPSASSGAYCRQLLPVCAEEKREGEDRDGTVLPVGEEIRAPEEELRGSDAWKICSRRWQERR
jgi:hypothetical protein